MRYWIDIRHDGLGKFRRISGTDRFVVEEKARLQSAAWERQWAVQISKQSRKGIQEEMVRLADIQSAEAKHAIKELETLLIDSVGRSHHLNWDTLKDKSVFSTPRPAMVQAKSPPVEPSDSDEAFIPKISFWDKFSTAKMKKKRREAREYFMAAHAEWTKLHAIIMRQNAERAADYNDRIRHWETARNDHNAKQQAQHLEIDSLRSSYKAGDPNAVAEYFNLIISRSGFPDWMNPDFDLEYLPISLTLIIDFQLPPPADMPLVKEVKYIRTKNELSTTSFSEIARQKLFDDLVYKVILRTLHVVFSSDTGSNLEAAVFNGRVKSTNPATGITAEACIVSLHVTKTAFREINLSQVDPRACFRQLRGVGSPKLHGLTPVLPVLQISRDDSRFINSREISSGINEKTNLAAMDWADFEHLVRELFEKELSRDGGEVRTTQASRDGGVDVIAFDPDPIRGGKIVIQAKRYTNIVGVSAIRDLYGTVVNEGATKGILITTSDYGPDAYQFASGKPLTLLNGNNLLALLEKHGQKAVIDIKEAKKILGTGGH